MSEENNQKQESGKIRKKFEAALVDMRKVMGGGVLFIPLKLASTEVQEAVKELAKKRKEALIETFQKEATEMIEEKMAYDKHVKQLQADFKKKEEEGMKKFVEKAEAIRKRIKDIQSIEKDYYDVILGISPIETSPTSEIASGEETEE